MAITIYENKAMSTVKMVTAGKRYYKTKDGLLVLEGDPSAYSLYAHPHHRVPEDELKALLDASGLSKPAVKPAPTEAPAPKPAPAKKKASSKKKTTTKA